MAIAKDGILGGFSGKVGNIVGLTLNGVPIMRAAPKASQKPPTEKQRLQRLKFSLALEFTKPFLEITQQFFNQSAFSGERRNLLILIRCKMSFSYKMMSLRCFGTSF